MIRKIQSFSRLTKNAVFQAIVGSGLFLLVAAFIMLMTESTQDDSGINSFFQSLWFSIVTVTSVGYGDLSPLTPLGKIAAIVIMFIGVGYIGVLTGIITSWLVERNRKKVLGLVPVKEMQEHFLICGWKQGMSDLLKDILLLHKKESIHLVLVNNAEAQEVNELRQDPSLRDFHFFSGDYTNTEVLLNACGNRASKVLILADELSGRPAEEIDFETVLAAIAIKRIYPQIYAIVEIIQPKFSLYLQNIDIEEIITNRFNARALICNMILMSGMNNVFKKLFSMRSGILKIITIADEYVGKTYQDLKDNVNNAIVIGILENTGNLRIRKNEKMNRIQKTVTIKSAIQGLMEIKKMEGNVPVFNPAPDYIVKENCSLIVLDVDPRDLNKNHPKEVIIEKIASKPPPGEIIPVQLEKLAEKAENWIDFTRRAMKVGLEVYQYRNEIAGVICREKKYTFESLYIPAELIARLNWLFEKKQTIEETIVDVIDNALDKAYSWQDFFSILNREDMNIYLYRGNVYGVVHKKKRYNFQTLGISKKVIEEINKHKELFSRTSKKKDPQEQDGEAKYLTLSEFMKEFKKERIVLKSRPGREGLLLICGWKPQIIEMVEFILNHHGNHSAEWHKIVVVADTDNENANVFLSHFGENPSVELYRGDFVDGRVLKHAGLLQATKVIILAETDSGKSFEEIDAKTVLTAMMIGSMNKQAYQVAEILDKRYEEALDQANVEEIFLEDEFIRIMLSNGSHGLGITKVLSEIINLESTLLDIADINRDYINRDFGDLRRDYYLPGKMILGILEETGNIYARKSEKINQAQIQSNIGGQVEELMKVKGMVPNKVVIAPDNEYTINPNAKLILINTNNPESWDNYLELLA
ncbi:MAG: hypothetical protein GY866_11660 [Proteobacteria bacterium]|nr:hypothetical protein [Pseudomonadota bacterium]